MNHEATIPLLISALAAMVITIAAMSALRPLAYVVDLLDRPGGHKTHSGAVPVVGGLAMLLGLAFGISTMPEVSASLGPYLMSATLLVVVGLIDDRFTLSPHMRLLSQFAAVLPMVFGAGVYMRDFGDLLGTGNLLLSHGNLLVTAFVTMAAVNAFNMLDGLDGLAGGLALTALVALLALGGDVTPAYVALIAVLSGAVLGFLVFNLPVRANRRIRCFMGDAGSTLLGFSIAWLAIGISQRSGSRVSAVTTVWFVAVPATDLLWTVIRRVLRRQSPFYPDTEHLHHLLLRAGFGVRAVFGGMFATAVATTITGLMLHDLGVPDWMSLLLLVAAAIAIVVTYSNARLLVPLVPRSLRRDPALAPPSDTPPT